MAKPKKGKQKAEPAAAATLPTVTIQSPSTVKSDKPLPGYKPLHASQNAASQWENNESDSQWGGYDNHTSNGEDWGSAHDGGGHISEAGDWAIHDSPAGGGEGNMNGPEHSSTAWGHGGQNAEGGASDAVNGWDSRNSGVGVAGTSVVTGWGDQAAAQSQNTGHNSPAVRFQSPHPPTPAPAAAPPTPQPPPPPQLPRTIQSTRAAFPPNKNKTSTKDDNWGNPLADADDWQNGEAYGGGWGPPQPVPPVTLGRQDGQFRGTVPPTQASGAWMRWNKEFMQVKDLHKIDEKAPIPPPALASHAIPSNGGGMGGRRPPASQQQNHLLHNILNDPLQAHARNVAWGIPQGQGGHDRHNQIPGYPRTHSGHDQQNAWGGQGWGDPQQQKHHKHQSTGQHRAQPMQPADSWGSTGWGNASNHGGASGWGERNDVAGWQGAATSGKDPWGATINEEEEEEEYDDDEDWGDDGYNDTEDEGWGQPKHKHKKHKDDYDPWGGGKPKHQNYEATPQQQQHSLHGHTPAIANQQLPYDPKASKTMNMAFGRMGALFESTPPVQLPQPGAGVIDSHGAGLKPAVHALYGRRRPTKERIHWMLNPDKDERVSSLLRWVQAMANELAAFGKFLHDGQRGALLTNADFRVGGSVTSPGQPAFDWVTIDRLQLTLDRIVQESVITYDPALHVVIYVFLLSHSGNSMAIWRRKVPIPDSLRIARRDEIKKVKDSLDLKYEVFVDQLDPSPPKKKRGFWRRLFGLRAH
ncbi:unnamed protein product [Somion occarium]|uniref:CcmS related domain-containing protein n=1 Tax=Somion occarium TaxID=3059160 RepID=A0ABP1D167_9APHY